MSKKLEASPFFLIILFYTIFFVVAVFNFQIAQGFLKKIDPTLLQGVGSAIIAIYIPIIIVLLSSQYSYKNIGSKDLALLDYFVVLSEFFNLKNFIWIIAFLFLSPLFWKMSNLEIKTILLSIFSIGIYYSINKLYKIWLWLRSKDLDQYRLFFLKRENDFSILSRAWSSIWGSKQLTPSQENKYFSLFKKQIDDLEDQDEFYLIAKLLDDFERFYKNRSFELNLSTKDALQELFHFHFIFWKHKENKKNIGASYLIMRTLEKIFEKNWIILMKYQYAYLFVHSLEEHIKKHIEDKIYLKNILRIFFNLIFEKIPKNFTIYDYNDYITMPESWKITSFNLDTSSNNFVPDILLKIYRKTMYYRVIKEKKLRDDDYKFDEFTMFLMPYVDPIKWGRLFIVYCYARNIERINQAVEQEWSVGKIGRSFSFVGESIEEAFEKHEEKEKAETFKLATKAFNGVFTKDRISRYITKLEEMREEYSESTKHKKHFETLKHLFKEFEHFFRNN